MENLITRVDYPGLRNEAHVELHDGTSLFDVIKKNGYTVDIGEQDQRRDAIFRGLVDAVKSAKNRRFRELMSARYREVTKRSTANMRETRKRKKKTNNIL
jgi:hypothetical protein